MYFRWSEGLHGVAGSPGVHFGGNVSWMTGIQYYPNLVFITCFHYYINNNSTLYIIYNIVYSPGSLCNIFSASNWTWSYFQYVIQFYAHVTVL